MSDEKPNPATEPATDAELETVVQIIRRGLIAGDKIVQAEEAAARLAVSLQEAARRLKRCNQIGQEVCRKFDRVLDPRKKQHMTALEATELMRWVQLKSEEMHKQLE